MPYISSANIACGYHAGDEAIIRKTIELCRTYNIAIGAHPSFEDRINFGRTEMHLPNEDIYRLVQDQIHLLIKVANEAGGVVKHVKPHGALYNMASRDSGLATVIVSAIKDMDETLMLYGLSGSHLILEGKKAGLHVMNEVFADRTYQDDGSLTPRSDKRALIEKAKEGVAQVLQMVQQGTVRTLSGKTISIEADTICIHGDGSHAVQFAKALHEVLEKEAIRIRPPS